MTAEPMREHPEDMRPDDMRSEEMRSGDMRSGDTGWNSTERTGQLSAVRSEGDGKLHTSTGETRGTEEQAHLISKESESAFSERWQGIQAKFVDEPRHAVEEADTLVAEVIQNVSERFATERSRLEEQWEKNDDVATEDLRIALQHYRSFFERLLAA